MLKNIRCYSFHGCLKEETAIGSDYRVDLSVNADLKKSAKTDQLKDTVDYVLLNRVVKEEMSNVDRFITLSPLTPIATHFHIKHGAKLININATSQNFEYDFG